MNEIQHTSNWLYIDSLQIDQKKWNSFLVINERKNIFHS